MQMSGDTKLIKPPHQHPGHSTIATGTAAIYLLKTSVSTKTFSDILSRLQNSKVDGKEFIMVRD